MGAGTFKNTPDTHKHTSAFNGNNLSFAVSHMCGWRTFMQDAHLAVSPLSNQKNSLFAVFDGHGELQKNKNYQNQNYELALKETFFKIDELMKTESGKSEVKQIQKQQNQNGNGSLPTESQAGCTANVWLLTPQYIYVANAGDSRGVLSVNKKCQQTSKDHKPQDKTEFQRIIKAGGSVTYGRVNGNLNLSRALGDFQFKKNKDLPPEEQMITAEPQIRKFKNSNIDFAIIGCDGIWEEKSCEEMVKWISQRIDCKTLGQIVEQLFDQLIAEERTMEAHGTDNMSAILIKFQTNKKTQNNDEISSLLQKYLIQKSSNKAIKFLKQRKNDQMYKLIETRYLK